MRWPSGPLEIARRQKEGFTPRGGRRLSTGTLRPLSTSSRALRWTAWLSVGRPASPKMPSNSARSGLWWMLLDSGIWQSLDGWTASPTAKLRLRLRRRLDSRQLRSRASGQIRFPRDPLGRQGPRAMGHDCAGAARHGQCLAGRAGPQQHRHRRAYGPALARFQRLVHPACQGAHAGASLGAVRSARKGRGRAGPELPAGCLRCRNGGRPLGDLSRRHSAGGPGRGERHSGAT